MRRVVPLSCALVLAGCGGGQPPPTAGDRDESAPSPSPAPVVDDEESALPYWSGLGGLGFDARYTQMQIPPDPPNNRTTYTLDDYTLPAVGAVVSMRTGVVCTATGVAPSFVLTSAHCVGFRPDDEVDPELWFAVYTGAPARLMFRIDRVPLRRTGGRWEGDPDTGEWRSNDVGNDIAIAHLATSLPATLHFLNMGGRLQQSTMVTMYGFGCNHEGSPVGVGRKQSTSTLWSDLLERTPACGGDSGGPVLFDRTGTWTVAALAVGHDGHQHGIFALLDSEDLSQIHATIGQ